MDQVHAWIGRCDGFVSANFHLSNDGSQVFNYAQWRDEASFNAFLNHARQVDLRAAIESHKPKSMKNQSYRLVSSYTA